MNSIFLDRQNQLLSSIEDDEGECLKTCNYLRVNSLTKQGSCPQALAAIGFEAACVESCTADIHCDSHLKCCANGCGWTCQEPVNLGTGSLLPTWTSVIYSLFKETSWNIGVPPIPTFINWRELNHRTATLWWDDTMRFSNVPVVYILKELKYFNGEKPDPNDKKGWTQILQTTRPIANVSISAGYTYQYAVAAVSSQGSLGFSNTSQEFRSSLEIRDPNPPRNLRVTKNTTVRDRQRVTVKWDPPAELDFPITRYKVFYRKIMSKHADIEQHQKSVHGDRHSLTLKDLDPNTQYLVQVQAIVQVGKKRYRSTKETMQMVTDNPLPPKRPAKPTYVVHTNNGLSVEVSWKRPVSHSPVVRYLVHLVMVGEHVADKDPPIVLGLNSNCTELVVNATMPANQTRFQFNTLRENTQYIVYIYADSEIGRSPPTKLSVKTPILHTQWQDTSPRKTVSTTSQIPERNFEPTSAQIGSACSLYVISSLQLVLISFISHVFVP
ncbi:anosmin-1 isoform X2 [Octopus vulgaris]|uniref:Anosmin-1 isoform X2 n=1 Tax=Octopus vulgaris TaxID=6645 RepID=A0AA36FJS6_OCTVU|nr:anosmin-1 isoform X2 [Octopus vulgaris]